MAITRFADGRYLDVNEEFLRLWATYAMKSSVNIVPSAGVGLG